MNKPEDYQLGCLVKFETSPPGERPRLNFAYDDGPSGIYHFGQIKERSETEFLVEAIHSKFSYRWRFSYKQLKLEGFPEVVKNIPKSYPGNTPRDILPKDIFHVELDENIKINGVTVSKKTVSRAARPALDDYATVHLLDFGLEGAKVLHHSPEVSWLEVSKISRSKYYRKRKAQLEAASAKAIK